MTEKVRISITKAWQCYKLIHTLFQLSHHNKCFDATPKDLTDSFTRITHKYFDSDGHVWHLSPAPFLYTEHPYLTVWDSLLSRDYIRIEQKIVSH